MKVDVIITGDGSRAMAAKQATREIPIVVAVLTDDPVASGLVDSLGQPGGNVTGLALFAPEMSGKRYPVELEVAGPNDIESAIERLTRERVGAVEALQAIEFFCIRKSLIGTWPTTSAPQRFRQVHVG